MKYILLFLLISNVSYSQTKFQTELKETAPRQFVCAKLYAEHDMMQLFLQKICDANKHWTMNDQRSSLWG